MKTILTNTTEEYVPEYPNGTYAYFATVDENWNSAYPYAVNSFYGVYSNALVNSVSEPTIYTSTVSTELIDLNKLNINVFPNPSTDLIAIQIGQLSKINLNIELTNSDGKLIEKKQINAGSTIAYFNTETLYNGIYLIKISHQNGESVIKKVVINR